ncbi:MAG: hypothetical protein LBD37_02340 [Treponema sp.]|jgi:hypothetical protein|nr:hypothetical protein [Treponema sp.]
MNGAERQQKNTGRLRPVWRKAARKVSFNLPRKAAKIKEDHAGIPCFDQRIAVRRSIPAFLFSPG